MKNKINLILSLIVLIVVGLACGDGKSDTTQKPAADPNEKPIEVKAPDLTKEYNENELAADGKYKGKLLSVSGKVSEIAETFGTISVDLEGHKESGINLLSVKCSFDDSQKEAVSKLKKGQQATVIGRGDGKTANLYVGLKECKIK